jgi:hypothetical protein
LSEAPFCNFFCLFQHLWKLFVRQCDVLEHEEHQSNLLHACYSVVRPLKLCVTWKHLSEVLSWFLLQSIWCMWTDLVVFGFLSQGC